MPAAVFGEDENKLVFPFADPLSERVPEMNERVVVEMQGDVLLEPMSY
jgi:hypothetical protein